MLRLFLERFNTALAEFGQRFPRPNWDQQFKDDLINDYSFFSSRIEDPKLDYGDTIRFLNNEYVNKEKLSSFLQLEDHRKILANMIERYNEFTLSEELIKDVHRDLMGSDLSWKGDYHPDLVGNYRNFPVSGSREPFFSDKDYAPHYNLDIIMSSHIEFFTRAFDRVDNKTDENHMITALAYFHNKFLNDIHPFADGNGRVCRIIMGTVMMKHGCPPIFPAIKTQQDMIVYINTIVACEHQNSDLPLVEFLANGMSEYLEARLGAVL